MSTVGALSAACAPEILKALNALSLQTNGFQAPEEIGCIHLKSLLVLKMESDHLSPANDISLVRRGGSNGWCCIQYRDRVIPLDNNHRILSSQWPHLPQMPLQRLGNFLSCRSSCNGPEIDFLQARWKLETVETFPRKKFILWEKFVDHGARMCFVLLYLMVKKKARPTVAL